MKRAELILKCVKGKNPPPPRLEVILILCFFSAFQQSLSLTAFSFYHFEIYNVIISFFTINIFLVFFI